MCVCVYLQMGEVEKVLRFVWRATRVDIRVDPDKTSMLDIVLDYEEEGKKQGLKLDYHFPTFYYPFKMETQPLLNDAHLIRMFSRLSDREIIPITVGTVLKPTELYKLVLNFRRSK